MPRIAAPRKWKDKFVTEAGCRMKVLCLIREGIVKARVELAKHIAQIEQEKELNRHGAKSSPQRRRKYGRIPEVQAKHEIATHLRVLRRVSDFEMPP